MWEPPARDKDCSKAGRNESFATILENLAYQIRQCYLYPDKKSIEKSYESFDTTFAGRSGVVDFTIKFRLHENREPSGEFLPAGPREGE